MTTRNVSMGLTLPAGCDGYTVFAVVEVSGFQTEISKVYTASSAETSISFTFDDFNASEVGFLFKLTDGGLPVFQPIYHGDYDVTTFGAA